MASASRSSATPFALSRNQAFSNCYVSSNYPLASLSTLRIFLQCFRTSWTASLRFNLRLSISLIDWAISSLTIRWSPSSTLSFAITQNECGQKTVNNSRMETKVETIGKKIRLVARKLLNGLARPEGFEPPTPRSVVWCSVQLSYGRGN
jgi:hypothetical protein